MDAKGFSKGRLLENSEWRTIIHVLGLANSLFGSCSLPLVLLDIKSLFVVKIPLNLTAF